MHSSPGSAKTNRRRTTQTEETVETCLSLIGIIYTVGTKVWSNCTLTWTGTQWDMNTSATTFPRVNTDISSSTKLLSLPTETGMLISLIGKPLIAEQMPLWLRITWRKNGNDGHNAIRYSFSCLQFGHRLSTCYDAATPYTFDGNGKVYYLDKLTAQYRDNYYLNRFHLDRSGGGDSWGYRIRCCQPWPCYVNFKRKIHVKLKSILFRSRSIIGLIFQDMNENTNSKRDFTKMYTPF